MLTSELIRKIEEIAKKEAGENEYYKNLLMIKLTNRAIKELKDFKETLKRMSHT